MKKFDPGPAIAVAQKLQNEGKYPSIEAIRLQLVKDGNGASPANVMKALAIWRERTGQAAAPPDNIKPQSTLAMSDRRIGVAMENIWAAAVQEARAFLKEDLAKLENEARVAADKLADAEERLRMLQVENKRLAERVTWAEMDQKMRADALWDSVMDTVAAILQAHGTLNVPEILEMLPGHLFQRARSIAEPLDLESLSERMLGR